MRAYLPAAAPLIAIINTVIAVYASHFKPEDRKIKIFLLSISIVLGSIAAIVTIISQYDIAHQRETEENQRRKKRETIASFITSSAAVMTTLQTPAVDDKTAENQTDLWYASALAYVGSMGPDYLARFQNTAGILPIVPSNISNYERANDWLGIYYRKIRLEQFESELSR